MTKSILNKNVSDTWQKRDFVCFHTKMKKLGIYHKSSSNGCHPFGSNSSMCDVQFIVFQVWSVIYRRFLISSSNKIPENFKPSDIKKQRFGFLQRVEIKYVSNLMRWHHRSSPNLGGVNEVMKNVQFKVFAYWNQCSHNLMINLKSEFLKKVCSVEISPIGICHEVLVIIKRMSVVIITN